MATAIDQDRDIFRSSEKKSERDQVDSSVPLSREYHSSNGVKSSQGNGVKPTQANGVKPTQANGVKPTQDNGVTPSRLQSHRFSFMRQPGPERVAEFQLKGEVTSLKYEVDRCNKKDCIYITTDQAPSLTIYNIKGGFINAFGLASGGVTLDPHPGRDCICLGNKGTIRRVYRDGSDLSMGYPSILHVKGAKNIKDIICVSKKVKKNDINMKVKYIAIDQDLACVLVIDPAASEVKRKIPDSKGDPFIPCSIAFDKKYSKNGAVVVSGGDFKNEVRFYSTRGQLLGNIIQDLKQPRGVCADVLGRIVVCNQGSGNVVRFTRRDANDWETEIILTEKELDGKRPSHVDIADSHMILVLHKDQSYFCQIYAYE